VSIESSRGLIRLRGHVPYTGDPPLDCRRNPLQDGLFSVRSPLLRESRLLSFPARNDMLKFRALSHGFESFLQVVGLPRVGGFKGTSPHHRSRASESRHQVLSCGRSHVRPSAVTPPSRRVIRPMNKIVFLVFP